MNDSHDNAADDLAMLERFADQQELLDCGCPREYLEDEGQHQAGCQFAADDLVMLKRLTQRDLSEGGAR